MQIRICHIRIEGEHRSVDLVVAEADEVLVDATGGQGHEPALLGLVQVGLEVTDLDDDDVCLRDIHAEQLKLTVHRVLVAIRGHDEAQAAGVQQSGGHG